MKIPNVIVYCALITFASSCSCRTKAEPSQKTPPTAKPSVETSTEKKVGCITSEVKEDPESCKHFLRCNWNIWVKTPCGPFNYYNPKTKECGHARDVPHCFTQKATTPTEPTTVTTELPTTTGKDGCTTDEKMEDPKSCRHYLICTRNLFVRRPCPASTFFNKKINDCDHENNVPHCIPTKPPTLPTTETTTVTTELPTTSEFSSNCKNNLISSGKVRCITGERIADPDSCSHFRLCNWGVFTRKACGAGGVFNPKTSDCDHPRNVPHCIPTKATPIEEHQGH